MDERVCPVWMGYFLACGLRKLLQNPRRILNPYVTPGMTALDFGCAMGFFSLPLAEAVGAEGKVVCVDLQPRMLTALQRRATRAGLADRIETHACGEESLGLDDRADSFDFALVFAALHEVPDQGRTLTELTGLLKLNAHLLLAEPAGHVKPDAFEHSVALACERGFILDEPVRIRLSHAVLLTKVAS